MTPTTRLLEILGPVAFKAVTAVAACVAFAPLLAAFAAPFFG
jgi:hypothetical protein